MNNPGISKCLARLACAALIGVSTFAWGQAGSLDPTFGINGIVTTPGTVGAAALALQNDGKIVVAGGFPINTVTTGLAVARYTTNGSLDSSFGSGGLVTAPHQSPAFAMALQSDGKILVAVPGPRFSISVIRFHTNGGVDGTFGTGGVANFRQFGRVFQPVSGSIVVQPDDKILLAVGSPLLRLMPNGEVDASFGKGGAASLIEATSLIALLPNGQIVAASSPVARYNADGSLDRTFGVIGQAPGLGGAAAIVPLSSSKFIVAGSLNGAVAPLGSLPPEGFSLVRYNTDGTIDATFGSHGGVITLFPGNAFSAPARLAVQTNGEIVAGGTTSVQNPVFGQSPSSFALARYMANGPLDATFGTGGRVTTVFGSDTAAISAIAIQSDGKIVAVGNEVPAVVGTSNNGFTLARYLAQ